MTSRHLLCLCLALATTVAYSEQQTVDTTPKLEILNKQIETNADDAQAIEDRAYTLALLGRKDEARADLKKALALKDTAPMHNRAGWAYFNLGDYADAVREFETSVKMSDYHAHYDYYSLVLGYWGTGQTKKALENYQLAVERDPRFGQYKTLEERTGEWDISGASRDSRDLRALEQDLEAVIAAGSVPAPSSTVGKVKVCG